jgi:CHAT domain-containing protein
MTSFFSRLHAGAAQSAALSETKREFLATPEFSRPLFWAPFVLYGD